MADPVYTPDFSAIQDALTTTYGLGTEWFIPLIITFLFMAVITRNISLWKILAFPILTILAIMQMPVSLILLTIAAFIFVLEIFSSQVIGKLLSPVRNWAGEKYKTDAEIDIDRAKTLKAREDIFKATSGSLADIGEKFGFEGKEYNRRLKQSKRDAKVTNIKDYFANFLRIKNRRGQM